MTDSPQHGLRWTIGIAGLTWLGTFFYDIAAYESFREIWTPHFLGLHVSQLVSVVVAVLAARRLN